ncbi:protein of unknown function [Burkholderia sp. WP9]|uniref:DUF3597 domain-containing protein n=1 Tax=Burkholderia sp. WP9 TaxID=1500263 RepID=UPI0008960F69|nr:DUF3597 domain-containing protein [Burkholderia sp. WP9]SEB94990.1 protein of unknown function [Burkholderia sp. WP9]
MGLFSSILSKIFPSDHPANAATDAAAPADASAAAPVADSAAPEQTPAPATGATAEPVDVEAVLTAMQAQKTEQLNWRTSIVDLLKLLDLDSSLSARKELAAELHYSGDTEDSSAMNIWLHKQVMSKLAENGGKLPADLKV